MRGSIRLVPLFVLGLLLASCGEATEPADTSTAEAGDEDDADAADDPEAADDPDAGDDADAGDDGDAGDDAGEEGSIDLALGDTELGEILVDGDGMTLYLFTEDPPGESVCQDDCLSAWPPLLVDGEPMVGDGLDPSLVDTITRDDGSTQVTYDDTPLYRWASDEQPGDVSGQDVQGVWFVVDADGSAIMETDESEEGAGSGPSY